MWEQLKNAREGRMLSQGELGSQCGIAGSTICAWENDLPKQIRHFKAMCEALGESPNAMLGWQAKEIDSDETVEGGALIVKLKLTREDLSFLYSLLDKREKEFREILMSGLIDFDLVKDINVSYLVKEKIGAVLEGE